MGDWQKSEAQLRKTINDMNVVTGANDTNIVDGVDRLIKGYGDGSNTSSVYIPTSKNTSIQNNVGISVASYTLSIPTCEDMSIQNNVSVTSSYTFSTELVE